MIKKVLEIFKKVVLVLAVYFIVISLFMYFINKDKPKITYDPIQKNRDEIYKVINDKKINSTKEGKATIAIYRTMMCNIFGEACTDDPNDGDTNFHKSLFGLMSKLIAFPYANPPASGVYWAYTGLQNAGFIPKTYAAEGIGFAALRPLTNIWKLIRDISYIILVLILIAIGFMIMFRMKLNPQTVISVENALPKIVVSLLLITFSFAIAGFIVDLMYILITVIIAVLGDNNVNFDIAKYQQDFLTAGMGKLWVSVYINPLRIGNALLNMLPIWLSWTIRAISAFLTLRLTNSIFGLVYPSIQTFDNLGVFTGIIGKFPSGVISFILIPIIFILGILLVPQLVIFLLILMSMLLLFFRIFILLFKSYLQILIMIIFAPIILLFEAIPGKSAFSFWLKNLLAEITTFPIVITLLIVGELIVKMMAAPGNFWTPPFLTGINPEAYGIIVGAGILFIIPDIIQLVKQQLFGVKGLGIDIGPGVFFGGVGTVVGGGTGLMGQIGSISLGLQAFAPQGGIRQVLDKMKGWASRSAKKIETES